MVEHFTQQARRVLSLAQEEAESCKHGAIAPEHLLLGMLRLEENIAGDVLRARGMKAEQIRPMVQAFSETKTDSNSMLELTPRTKQLLELAVDEARRRGHHVIGTEHLLLGIIRQSNTGALNILQELNISREKIREEINRRLGERPAWRIRFSRGSNRPYAPADLNAPLPPNRFIRFINRLFRINL
jgi:ATP-dependent Clp protease ATP-binding subunit ClpC